MNRVMASSRSCRSVIRVPSMSCACSSSDSKFIAPRPSGLRRRSALADHAVDEVVQAVDRGPVPQVARRRDAVGDGERPAESYRDFLDYDLERRLDLLDLGSDVAAQEGPGCNARCEAHHVLVHVTHLPVTPGGQDLGGAVHHDRSVTGDLLAMESRLA